MIARVAAVYGAAAALAIGGTWGLAGGLGGLIASLVADECGVGALVCLFRLPVPPAGPPR